MKKHRILLISGICLFLAGGCGKTEELVMETESTIDPALKRIVEEHEAYQQYSSDIIHLENSDTYIYLFTAPESGTGDVMNPCVDIWVGDGESESLYQEQQSILPDSYGQQRIGDYEFFRYDIADAAKNRTVLMEVEQGICEDTYYLPGTLTYVTGNNFNVKVTAVDAEFDVESGKGMGRTEKEYYFYVDDAGYHECTALEITQEELSEYGRAEEILAHLQENYGAADTGVSYEYLLRSNRYIHINIFKVEEGITSCFYETYQYMDGVLMMVENGQGRYLESAG